jgi:hypothetical protein
MSIDYSKFKTPYFDIEVGDSSWKTIVKLPEYLLRLITKVEVMEAFFTAENAGSTQLTIAFAEGFDKQSGFITDLVFDGKQGIGTLTEDGKKKANSAPKFLFQEKNKVKITWGYLEDKDSSRSYMGFITQAATTYSESGLIATTITCLPWTLGPGDQLSTRKGVAFGTKQKLSKSGDSLVIFNDLKTDDLIRKLAKELNMATIISKNLHNDIVDKNKQKMWIAGESFQQFMTRLAKASGCTYGIESDPNTGKEVIIFIKKQDFEKRVVLADKNLLAWKEPGSILKSINLHANFGGLVGSSQKGINNEGKVVEDDEVKRRLLAEQKSPTGKNTSVAPKDLRVEQTSSTTGKAQNLIDVNPVGNNPIASALPLRDTISNGGVVGTVDITPAQNKQVVADKAAVKADDLSKLIQLDFSTIGYTKLTPGIVEISGIGVRYSGKYRILTVTHTIDSSGYVTKCTATSQALASGGVSAPDIDKAEKDDTKDRRVLNQATADPLAQLRKLQGIA